jgi:hypothetical protein
MQGEAPLVRMANDGCAGSTARSDTGGGRMLDVDRQTVRAFPCLSCAMSLSRAPMDPDE